MESNMKSVLRKYLEMHGDGRHLEKFLRRNSYSSDEREMNVTTSTNNQRNKTKSLESLKSVTKDETPQKDELLKESKSKRQPKQAENPEISENKPMEQSTKVVVKQSSEKSDKKRSNKFNYESVIEITLPPNISSVPIPQLPAPTADMQQKVAPQQPEEDKQLEEPITPVITEHAKPKTCSKEVQVSPSKKSSKQGSSVSNKQNQNPLEWDPFIPGFDSQQQNLELCNPMEFGENEINALKTYFSSIGLQLPSENLVVLIKNRKETTIEREKREFVKIKETKDKWQKIYEKYKEKYSTYPKPEAHSTPKLQESVQSVISEKKFEQHQASFTPENTPEMKNSSKECQETSTNRNMDEKSETFYNHTEAAESFEFVAGSHRKQEKKLNDFSETEMSSQSSSKVSESTRDRQEEISNFDDSLKVAIALLNSLLEARHMKPELKRNLAGKVIQKIVQIQTSRSIQTSTLGSSGFYPISHSSTSENSAKTFNSVKDSKNTKNVPTQSKRTEEAMKKCFEPLTISELNYRPSSKENSVKSEKKEKEKSKNLMELMKREKSSHLKWIEKEIAHLKDLRELLCKNDSTSSSDPIYENVGSLACKKPPIDVPKPPPIPTQTNPAPPIYESSKWNSHVNNRKTHKTRGKLQTPVGTAKEDDLANLIYDRNKKLAAKYQEIHKVYEEINVYTKPRKIQQSQRRGSSQQQEKMMPSQDVQTSTSLASSVLDCDSKSSDDKTRTKSKTKQQRVNSATHKNNVETQTTDTIYRTKPIFETKELHESDYYEISTKGTVKRVQKNDKRMQARPASIKYTLSFDRRNRAEVRPFMSLPTAHYSEEISTEISSKISKNKINSERSTNPTDNNKLDSDDKENCYYEEFRYEEIDLRTCFNSNRPETFSKFEQRKKCIEELKKLRALRNEHRNKLLLLTSDKSLKGKLFNSLPELPLRTTRIFSTRDLKLQTQKKIKNLAEFKKKKNDENVRNIKRKNRLMTKIFNKNLQREALKGNLNLSNTANLISHHR